MDNRDLNYDKFFVEGERYVDNLQDYILFNTG